MLGWIQTSLPTTMPSPSCPRGASAALIHMKVVITRHFVGLLVYFYHKTLSSMGAGIGLCSILYTPGLSTVYYLNTISAQ